MKNVGAWIVLGICCFAIVFGLPYLSLRLAAIALLSVTALFIFALPDRYAFFIMFFYVGFEGFFKIVSSYHPIVHVGSDLLVVASFLKVVARRVWQRAGIPWPPPPLTMIYLLHFGWFFVVFANPYALSLVASLAGAKVYFTMLLLYFFGYHITTSVRQIQWFLMPWVVVSIVHMVLSLRQASGGPQSVLALHPGYAAPLAKFGAAAAFRPFGATHLPGGPAMFLFIAAPFFIYFMISLRSFWLKGSLALCLPFNLIVFMLCQVRAALLKGLLGTALFILLMLYPQRDRLKGNRRRWGQFSTGVVLATLLGMLAFYSDDLLSWALKTQGFDPRAFERTLTLFDWEKASAARIPPWQRFIDYSMQVPLGAGLSRTGAAAGKFKELIAADPMGKDFFTDNLFLAVLIDLGIPGVLLFLVLLGAILWRGFRQCFTLQLDQLRLLNMALFSALFSIAIGSYGGEAIVYNPEAAFFWFFSGVMVRLPSLDRSP